MVGKAFIVLLHAVILFFVVIDILYIVIDVLLNLPAKLLPGIILNRFQEVADVKGCEEFSVLHFQYMRHIIFSSFNL